MTSELIPQVGHHEVMGPPAPIEGERWCSTAEQQAGIISRRQLLALGISAPKIRTQIDGRRWCVLLPGVYATFTGPVTATGRTWAAVLYGVQYRHLTQAEREGRLPDPLPG